VDLCEEGQGLEADIEQGGGRGRASTSATLVKSYEKQAGAPYLTRSANPGPLGLLCFGMTTIQLMFLEMGWAEAGFKDQIASTAAFYGGSAQVLAGIFEMIRGSTFAATGTKKRNHISDY
jgi:succinate-acetate transporter protein